MYLAYLYVIAIIFVVLGLIAGGAATLVLIPIAAIVVVGALLGKRFGLGSEHQRKVDRRIQADAHRRAAQNRPAAGTEPETPEDLVDARRSAQ